MALLHHTQNAAQIKLRYRISSSAKPASCQANSFGTPTGLHQIADCIGATAPAGMVFKGRRATGRLASEYPLNEQASNLITSRILRLRGLELAHNSGQGCDSFERYIYIHGTNHEDRIGQPFSGGCIEMFNFDIIALFEIAQQGDLVYIFN